MLDTVILTILYGVVAICVTVGFIEAIGWKESTLEKIILCSLAVFFWHQLLRVWGVI